MNLYMNSQFLPDFYLTYAWWQVFNILNEWMHSLYLIPNYAMHDLILIYAQFYFAT